MATTMTGLLLIYPLLKYYSLEFAPGENLLRNLFSKNLIKKLL